MKKEILFLPNEKLRKVSEPVERITPDVQKVIRDLIDSLRNSERPGVGLAAPQIGQNLRIIVMEAEGYTREDGEQVDRIPLTVLVNPVITKYSKDKCEMDEGCLSVPDLMGKVTRPKKIKIEAINQEGKKVQINASGFLARVLQHEIDHLNGILFIDLIKDKEKIWEIIPENSNES